MGLWINFHLFTLSYMTGSSLPQLPEDVVVGGGFVAYFSGKTLEEKSGCTWHHSLQFQIENRGRHCQNRLTGCTANTQCCHCNGLLLHASHSLLTHSLRLQASHGSTVSGMRGNEQASLMAGEPPPHTRCSETGRIGYLEGCCGQIVWKEGFEWKNKPLYP